jgi:CrcB protein
MKSYLLIALCGAFGTLAKYSVIQFTPKIFQTIFTIGAHTVNLLGCFLIDLVFGILDIKFLTIDWNFKHYITNGFLEVSQHLHLFLKTFLILLIVQIIYLLLVIFIFQYFLD